MVGMGNLVPMVLCLFERRLRFIQNVLIGSRFPLHTTHVVAIPPNAKPGGSVTAAKSKGVIQPPPEAQTRSEASDKRRAEGGRKQRLVTPLIERLKLSGKRPGFACPTLSLLLLTNLWKDEAPL